MLGQRWLARQLGQPTGLGGRYVARLLNRGNADTNAKAIAWLDVQPGDRVLDAGFGGGVGLAALLASPAATVTGVDHAETMVEAARARHAGDERLVVVAASLDALPFADGAFERILSVHTVYFWADAAATARELARVLAPGGRLVLGAGRKAWMAEQRVHRTGFALYEDEELAELLRGAGLTGVRVEGDGPIFVIGER